MRQILLLPMQREPSSLLSTPTTPTTTPTTTTTRNAKIIINDIRSKRDALSIYHHRIKKDADDWNKLVISLSLFCGFVETAKIQLMLTTDFWKLLPIAINTTIAICSSLVKFRDYPRRQEVVLGARDMLSHFLTKIRSKRVIDEETMKEYHSCLEFLEVSITPAERAEFLKVSQKNLIRIMESENKYNNNIDRVGRGEHIELSSMNDEEESMVPSESHTSLTAFEAAAGSHGPPPPHNPLMNSTLPPQSPRPAAAAAASNGGTDVL